MDKAIDAAHAAGRKVAFTLSDSFCVDRHRDDFCGCSTSGAIDILFANEAEMLRWPEPATSRAPSPRWRPAGADPGRHPQRSRRHRRSRGGERADVPAEPIERLVDTTGAGDLFAAGFLAGEARGLGLEASLKLGAIAAAEVIQHYGARPEADLKALAGSLLA